jgi:hypothetical protein
VNIADLSNFGLKWQQMLALAGILALEQLRGLGEERARLQVNRPGACSRLNLMRAMVDTLSEPHWQEMAKHDRWSLLLELEDVGIFIDSPLY